MNTPVLKLDPGDVKMAMSYQTTEWLLDPATGKLCMDSGEASLMFGAGNEEAELWAPTDPQQVLEIPHFSSSDGYELMQEFAFKRAGSEASQHLQDALDKRKPFRQFKYVLGEFPDDRRRWFEFEAEEMKRIAEDFYEAEGYTVRWTQSPAEPTGQG